MRPHSRLADAGEFLRISTEALGRYRLRTFLSVLGVILGVAAVIAMMSVAEGARHEALAQIQALGLENVVVRGKASQPGRVLSLLRAGDADALAATVPALRNTSPVVERLVRVAADGSSSMTRVLGVGAAYQTILRLSPEHGRLLSAIDEQAAAPVCVLGASLSRRLFGYRNPVGRSVMIGPRHFKVVGTLRGTGADPQSAGALAWRNIDEVALVPFAALTGQTVAIVPDQAVDEIWVQTERGADVDEIGAILQHTMGRLHGGDASFEIIVPKELLAQRYRTQRVFGIVVGSVAAVALLIGGIGVMNIMLTSVVERTKEIGVRRTVGATRRDIALQFLSEALLMTMTGGVAGILVGIGLATTITAFAGWATRVSSLSIALGFLVSFVVGLAFGLYPAVRAAAMQPVDAVRYE